MTAVNKLLLVQEKDLRIRQIEKELRDIPARKQEEGARLDRFKKSVEESKDALKARQSELKQLEVEADAKKDRITKLRQQQLELKTNKEFKTMEEEISGVSAGIHELEDRELAIMEQIEAARALVASAEGIHAGESVGVQKDVAVLDQRAQEVQNELKALKVERQALAAEVDPKWLSYYDRAFPTKDRAVVPLEAGICGGCHMKLPPAVAHDVRKQHDLVTCGYCGRLLYFKA